MWTGPFKDNFGEHLTFYLYSIEWGEPHFLRLLDRAAPTGDAAQIEVLELGSLHAYTAQQWTNALAPFVNVQTLYLENMHKMSLLSSLMPSTSRPRVTKVLALPNLRFLWLESLEFDESQSAEQEALPGLNRVQFVRMLLARKQNGRPIEHLRIEELCMERQLAEWSFLPRIRAIVPLVECGSKNPPNSSDA